MQTNAYDTALYEGLIFVIFTLLYAYFQINSICLRCDSLYSPKGIHMKKLTSILVLLLLVVLPFSVASAQLDEDENVFVFHDGTEFEIPEDWEVINTTDDWNINISDGTTIIYFVQYFPEELEALDISEAADLMGPQLEVDFPDHDFDDDEIEEVEIADLEGVRYEFTYENQDDVEQQVVMYIVIDDNDYGWVIGILPVEDEELDDEDEATEIAFSVFGEADQDDDDRGGDGEDITEFEFNDGSVFEVPEDWTVTSTTEDYYIELNSEELGLFIFQYYPETLEEGRVDDLFELIEFYYSGYEFAEDVEFDEDDVEEIEIADLDAVQYAFDYPGDSGDFEIVLVATLLDNDYAFVAGVFPLEGERLRGEDDALEIFEAFLEDNQ